MEVSRKPATPSVPSLFGTMEYGPAPESDDVAQAWLQDHDRAFGHFIDNKSVDMLHKLHDTYAPRFGSLIKSATLLLNFVF